MKPEVKVARVRKHGHLVRPQSHHQKWQRHYELDTPPQCWSYQGQVHKVVLIGDKEDQGDGQDGGKIPQGLSWWIEFAY
jgi:hypothetical protein